jgi:hypothetical protein
MRAERRAQRVSIERGEQGEERGKHTECRERRAERGEQRGTVGSI